MSCGDPMPSFDWLNWLNTLYRAISVSCVLAASANISSTVFLGRMLATSYSVLGHLKTMIILLSGWIFFNERVGYIQLLGVSVAVLGVLSYSAAERTPPVISQCTTDRTGAA